MGRPQMVPPDLRDVFRASELELWALFKKSAFIKHSGEKGTYREDGVAKFLRSQLPGRYGVVKGELIDKDGRRSGQIDIVVFDSTRAAPFVRGAKHAQWTLPAEAVLSTIEVKSRLTKTEIEAAAVNVSALHNLRPWGQPFSVITGYREELPEPIGARVQTSVFAFETDLGEEEWAIKEIRRARSALSQTDAQSAQLDRIVVLDRGMVNVAKGNALLVGEQGVLLDWYLTLLNFLEREVQRRKAIPFDEYRPNRDLAWKRIIEDDFPGSAERRKQQERVRRVAPLLRSKLGPGRR